MRPGESTTSYPAFLSTQPSGADAFESGAHQNVADSVVKIILNDHYKPKIIGLEGPWGAGKSNVVKLISSKLVEKNHVFVFDAWGNQEDLTRKSFLEQLLNELNQKEVIKDAGTLSGIKKQLLARRSTRQRESFPVVKSYWVLITAAIILFLFLKGLYEAILSRIDLIKGRDFGIWKAPLSIFLFPMLLFVWAISLIIIEYKTSRAKLKLEKKSKSPLEILGIILHRFKGKELEYVEEEVSLEDEPSVYRFKDYFRAIETELNSKGLRLVVVFDNLDRLEQEKVKSLWSSIHTFFSDSDNPLDSWVIIPYSRNELTRHFGKDPGEDSGEGFIEKLIPINFRITPPITKEWETFFNDKFSEAFGPILFEPQQKEKLRIIFDCFKGSAATPRQVVKYINDIVALYKLRQADMEKGDISITHLAIFALTQYKFKNDPVIQILSREYLGPAKYLFEFDDIENIISALTFGIPLEHAEETLLYKGIRDNFLQTYPDDITFYTKHGSFPTYFDKAYRSIPIKDKVHSTPEILQSLEGLLSAGELCKYWKNYATQLLTLDEHFTRFSDLHRSTLIHTKDGGINNKLVEKLIESVRNAISLTHQETQEDYYKVIIQLKEFSKENDLGLHFSWNLEPVQFSAESLLKVASELNTEYKDLNIYCKEADLIQLYSEDGYNDGNLNYLKILDDLDTLQIIQKLEKFAFWPIIDNLKAGLHDLDHNYRSQLEQRITIINAFQQGVISLELSYKLYENFSYYDLRYSKCYYDYIAIGISEFSKSSNHEKFQQCLADLTKDEACEVAKRLLNYVTFENFLKLICYNKAAEPFKSLNQIANNLLDNANVEVKFDKLPSILSAFSVIVKRAFNNNPNQELKLINILSKTQYLITGDNIDPAIFRHFNQPHNPLIKAVIEKGIKIFQKLNQHEYCLTLKDTQDKDYLFMMALIDNKIPLTFNSEFKNAFKFFSFEIAKGISPTPHPMSWIKIQNSLDEITLRSTFLSIRDFIANSQGISLQQIYFFQHGLIKYGNLIEKATPISLKFIMPLIKSDKYFKDIFLNKYQDLLPVIMASKHKETLLKEIYTKCSQPILIRDKKVKKLLSALSTQEDSSHPR